MFDAREAKLLASGAHLTIDGHPGLRLEASTKGRAWTYRYKSPLDGRMRQVQLGQWPGMPFAQGMVSGTRHAILGMPAATRPWEKRAARANTLEDAKQAKASIVMTVARVCVDYHDNVLVHRR